MKFSIDVKWLGSVYALLAVAVCMLVFSYNGVDFLNAFFKTTFTSVSFYIFGVVTASFINMLSNAAHNNSNQDENNKK